MNRLIRSLSLSALVLLAGLAVVGVLMFAFAQNAEAENKGPRAVGSKLEVAISDNGRVIVRGAEVTEISGDTIRVKTEWGATELLWRVDTNNDTAFVEKSGSGSELSDISVGDYVSFSGEINEGEPVFTVSADAVKNWSLGEEPKIRAEAKVHAKTGWGNWMNAFSWFTKGDAR